jgi:hypothetical protein
MLKLVKIGLINWYLASREDLDVVGHLAILGRNTHGKSTLLDMMQTVLTGYNKSFSDFNASAADGKKKKSKRTVRDYCLGAYNIGLFVRPTARTIIFLGFEDANTNRKMTIGVALEADKNVSGEHLLDRFIIEGAVLSTDLFVEKIGGKERVRDWPSARAALQQAGTAVHFDTSSENYIKNWTRLGSTGKRPINPKRLMKALVNAISFEEISSASDFVKRYILGDDKLDIGELKTSIKTYHDLHRRIVELKTQLDDADEILANARLHERYFKLSDDWNGAAALLDFAAARSINMGLRRDASRHRAKAAEAETEIASIRSEIATQEAAIKTINQVLAADINKNSKRAVLEAQRDKEKERRDNAEKNLSKLWKLSCRLVQDMNAVSKLTGIGPVADPLRDLAKTVTSAQHPNWPTDADRQTLLDAATDILGQATKTQDNLRNFAGTLATSRIQAESRIAELDGILRNIRQHGMAVTTRTSDFVSVLKDAGMDPKVLCQLIEVTDETWRDAAEVMLGADREAIIVGARHARSAKQILRDGGSKFDGLRIVGTDKDDWKAQDARPDSLAAIIASDDIDARILVSKRLGSIRRVEHVSEMSRAGRAITPDLVFDDGIVTSKRRLEGGRKIGASAANPAQLAAEVSALETEARSIVAGEKILGQALNTLGEFAQLTRLEIVSIIDSFATAAAALAAATEAYKNAEQDIDPELAQELENANATLATCRSDLEAALEKRKDHIKEMESADRIRQQGEASLGSDFSVLKKRTTLKHHRSQANRRDAFAHARGLVDSRPNANLLKSATDKAWSNAAKARDDLTRERGKVYDGVMEFNSRYQAATGFVRNVTPITEIKLYFENLAEQIRTGSLV